VRLMSRSEAERRKLPVLAEWLDYGESAADTPYLATVPASAVQAALKKLGLRVADMELFEINEAFSAVACTAMDLLGVDEDRVNVDGGAVAIGHPIGASGARILMHLVYALRRRGGGYGGAGLDHLAFAIFIEEVAKHCASTAIILDVHASVGSEPITLFGSEAQKRRWLPGMAAGKLLGAFALTEPEAGSDAAHLQTSARRRNGVYVLNGTKTFITNAGQAGLYVVMAATQPGRGAAGTTAFVVGGENPGLKVGPPFAKMGLNGSPIAEIVLQDCQVGEDDRLGAEGDGFRIAMRALDTGRIGISAQAVGLAQGALDDAVAYAKERRQFGRPIAEQQAIQFKL